jgi:MFS family permease
METNLIEKNPCRVEKIYSEKQIQHNFNLSILNGSIYLFASSLVDPTLVLVTFLSNFTQSALLLGLIVPITQAGWSLPQLWISGSIQNQPLKVKIYRQTAVIRILSWGILATTINLVENPQLLLILFFISFSISSLASGLGGLPFLEIISKTIPTRRRGELFAWRLGIGGLLSIAGGFIVQWILGAKSPFSQMQSYGILAAAYFVLASIAIFFIFFIQEKKDEFVQPRRSGNQQLREGISLLRKNHNFRKFISYQTMMIISGVAVPFFAIFVQQQLGGEKSWIGIYLIIIAITNLTSNLIFGRISRRISNKLILRIATIAGLMMSLWVLMLALLEKPLHLSPTTASIALAPAFILSAIRLTGVTVAGNPILLSFTPPQTRSLMLGFTQTLLGIVLLISGFSGLIINWVGFVGLLIVTVIASLMALYFVKEIQEGNQ